MNSQETQILKKNYAYLKKISNGTSCISAHNDSETLCMFLNKFAKL